MRPFIFHYGPKLIAGAGGAAALPSLLADGACLFDALDRMIGECGLAPRLRDHGIGEADLAILAREAMKQTRLLQNNPCPIDEADARRLYEAAW